MSALRWPGVCRDCGREREIETRIDHAAKTLCDECAAKPHRPPRATPDDFRESGSPPADAGSSSVVAALLDAAGGVQIGRTPPPPLAAVPGFPFLYAGANAHMSGPTGAGKSAVIQACSHDAAAAGIRVLYVSFEIDGDEANARATEIAIARGDHDRPGVIQALRTNLVFADGWTLIPAVYGEPAAWPLALRERGFQIVIIDPASAATSCVGLDDNDNADWMRWRGRVISPLRDAGVASVVADNIGHDQKASKRSKGASQKGNAADVELYSKRGGEPADPALVLVVRKARSTRAPFRMDDAWIAYRHGASGPVPIGAALGPGALRSVILDAAEDVLAREGRPLGWQALRDRIRAAPYRVSASTDAIRGALADGASDTARALERDPSRGFVVPVPDPGDGLPASSPSPHAGTPGTAGDGYAENPDEYGESDPSPPDTQIGDGIGAATRPDPGGSKTPGRGRPGQTGDLLLTAEELVDALLADPALGAVEIAPATANRGAGA